MANLKISDYIDIDSIDGTELILVSKSGAYRKTTIEEIRNLASDITNTALANLVGKVASAQDVKNILNNIDTILDDHSNSIEGITTKLSEKAQDSDSTRTTVSKTVTGAINELNSNKAPLASPTFSGTPKVGTYNLLEALNGGYKIQSGQLNIIASTANTLVTTSVTFPTAFVSTCSGVLVSIMDTNSGKVGYIYIGANNLTTTGFKIDVSSYIAQTVAVQWLAIGI